MDLDLDARDHDWAAMLSHLTEGRAFALASFALVIFDYFITVDSEIRHFWSGPWTISRILFLCNRYFSLAVMGFRILADFLPNAFPDGFCTLALRINFPLNLMALALVQGIIVIRIWYLFSTSKLAQRLLLATYLSCTIASFTVLGLKFQLLQTDVQLIPTTRFSFCKDKKFGSFWHVFIPSFVLHVVLQIYILMRIWRNVMRGDKSVPLRKRLTRDGGFLYMVIFFSVSFSVCSAIFGASPSIGVVQMFANFMLALLSITVSRVMFHIVVLAKRYSDDPTSKDPILLLRTASVDTSKRRTRMSMNMGILLFVPSDDMVDQMDLDDDGDSMYGWRELDEKRRSALDEVYY